MVNGLKVFLMWSGALLWALVLYAKFHPGAPKLEQCLNETYRMAFHFQRIK